MEGLAVTRQVTAAVLVRAPQGCRPGLIGLLPRLAMADTRVRSHTARTRRRAAIIPTALAVVRNRSGNGRRPTLQVAQCKASGLYPAAPTLHLGIRPRAAPFRLLGIRGRVAHIQRPGSRHPVVRTQPHIFRRLAARTRRPATVSHPVVTAFPVVGAVSEAAGAVSAVAAEAVIAKLHG